VTLPPSRALTVMPFAGSAFFVPGAGVIARYLAATFPLPATEVGFSWTAFGVLLWHAAASRQNAAASAAAQRRRLTLLILS
jgi:hypothetical protein